VFTTSLSSLGGERDDFFVERLPEVVAALQTWNAFQRNFDASEARLAAHFVPFVCFVVYLCAFASRRWIGFVFMSGSPHFGNSYGSLLNYRLVIRRGAAKLSPVIENL